MSQGDRLRERGRQFGLHPIRVDDDTEARQDVEAAQRLLHILQIQGAAADEEAARDARAALAEARKRLRDCYEWIPLRAMKVPDFEKLKGEHKPRPDTEDQMFNRDTFPLACLLACDESGRSTEDWEHLFEEVLSGPEQTDLCNAAIRVNVRTPDESLPKDWTSIEP